MSSVRDRSPAATLVRFLHLSGRLKSLPRTGWLDRGVPALETESVADHSFRLALLAWLAAMLPGSRLDAERVLKLALIHDLAEAMTGDEPPYDAADVPAASDAAARRRFLQQRHVRDSARSAAKRATEAAAMTAMLADLPPALRAEIELLWAEYQDQSTPEATFVKQADRLETYLQAQEYLATDAERPMDSFAAEVAEAISDPRLQRLRDVMADWSSDNSAK